jgi:hypothetical protein
MTRISSMAHLAVLVRPSTHRPKETVMGKLRLPTPAMLIALAALVVASTGSAVAATVITSRQIKNGTSDGQESPPLRGEPAGPAT